VNPETVGELEELVEKMVRAISEQSRMKLSMPNTLKSVKKGEGDIDDIDWHDPSTRKWQSEKEREWRRERGMGREDEDERKEGIARGKFVTRAKEAAEGYSILLISAIEDDLMAGNIKMSDVRDLVKDFKDMADSLITRKGSTSTALRSMFLNLHDSLRKHFSEELETWREKIAKMAKRREIFK
jgi:hypothetical protein